MSGHVVGFWLSDAGSSKTIASVCGFGVEEEGGCGGQAPTETCLRF